MSTRVWLILTALLTVPAFPAVSAEPVTLPTVVVTLINDVTVAAADSGIVEEVDVRVGENVIDSQSLLKLRASDRQIEWHRAMLEHELAREEAKHELKQQLAEKSLLVAASELERAELSRKKFADSVSESEVEKLRFLKEQAELQVEQARYEQSLAKLKEDIKEHDSRLARHRLEETHLQAPIHGQVVSLERKPGEWVQQGEPVCRIINLDRLRAEVYVTLQQGVFKPGQKVSFRWRSVDASEMSELSGKLTFVDPEINRISGEYRMWAEIDNPNGDLRPGIRGELIIHPYEKEPVGISATEVPADE